MAYSPGTQPHPVRYRQEKLETAQWSRSGTPYDPGYLNYLVGPFNIGKTRTSFIKHKKGQQFTLFSEHYSQTIAFPRFRSYLAQHPGFEPL
ncbi:hypothetical protein THOB06_10514 [Vibrio rotiferianus]|nr:hypothetical protein THOG10_10512 [Vibrio rotiferianus]CAH1558390.1 hypothetical protein THOB06_10514 [Vibrio rotiferianus]